VAGSAAIEGRERAPKASEQRRAVKQSAYRGHWGGQRPDGGPAPRPRAGQSGQAAQGLDRPVPARVLLPEHLIVSPIGGGYAIKASVDAGMRTPGGDNVGTMTFSVVIPAYEAARTLGETIRSVLAQTRQDFEVIVVDDGSRDATSAVAEAIAAEDDRIKLYQQANAGPSAARNRGISAGDSDYVSMLDSDDLWLPDYLAEMGRALDLNPHASFAYTDAWVFEEASGRFHKATAMARQRPPREALSHERFVARLMQDNFIFSSVTVRRSALEQVGGFDPNMPYAEDYDLWLRMVTSGFEAVGVADPLAIKRDRPDSRTFDQAARGANVMVYRAVLERHAASAQVKALAEARLVKTRELDERRSRLTGRVLMTMRDILAAAARAARSRRRLRAEPPPRVAQAFPELGRASSRPHADG
jgi:GT2 family glycosyltransferase